MNPSTRSNLAGDHQKYVAAVRHSRLNWLYDPLAHLMRDRHIKTRLVEQMRIQPGHRVLDVGCGTGTLLLLIKGRHPESEVLGLDGDTGILEIARQKAARAGLDVKLQEAMAFSLPFAGETFDRVASTLMLHHLTRENKLRTLREAYRVLRPGGELHVADFGKPQSALTRFISLPALLGEPSMVRDNLEGLIPDLIGQAGFERVELTGSVGTVFGTVTLYVGRKPGVGGALLDRERGERQ